MISYTNPIYHIKIEARKICRACVRTLPLYYKKGFLCFRTVFLAEFGGCFSEVTFWLKVRGLSEWIFIDLLIFDIRSLFYCLPNFQKLKKKKPGTISRCSEGPLRRAEWQTPFGLLAVLRDLKTNWSGISSAFRSLKIKFICKTPCFRFLLFLFLFNF